MWGKLQLQFFDRLIKFNEIEVANQNRFIKTKNNFVQTFEVKCFVSTINNIGQNGDVYAMRKNCLTQNELTYNTLTSP